MEQDVGLEVGLQVAGPPVHGHVHDGAGEDAALLRAWPGSAAYRAAAGSNPARSSDSERSWSARPLPASRQRMSMGSKTFQCARGDTVTPTRRRLVTKPIDSSTRTASRATVRDTA